MDTDTITTQAPTTLGAFYDLMGKTRTLRHQAATALHRGDVHDSNLVDSLSNALEALRGIPEKNGRQVLALDEERTIVLDLRYERFELFKDILFLTQGEDALLDFLGELHQDFGPIVSQAVEQLSGIEFRSFISDRDGTTNNYCGRYLSSVQSLYNALFLTRFATRIPAFPILLTSAPLAGPGIADVSVQPDKTCIYAASKGREFFDLAGERHSFPIDPAKQAVLDVFNTKLAMLLGRPEYVKYTLIGSGLQHKFGQTTVARQDISRSIDEMDSEDMLTTLRAIMDEADPNGTSLRIEDTGLDVEIILTVDDDGDNDDAEKAAKDFDKGDGVRYLDDALGMDMVQGPHLVCGDTGSDVPMLEAAMALSPDTRAVFVTRNEALMDRVRGVCPAALFVPEPDMLVTILRNLAA